ncbi:hypothetical protein F4805DRAFT_435908, partial [Annulohypoxylon moriforme]
MNPMRHPLVQLSFLQLQSPIYTCNLYIGNKAIIHRPSRHSKMRASFEALPIEVVEQIVTLLDLQSIASLRLTCHNIKSKASQGCFAKFFIKRDIKLTPRTLQDVLQLTSHDYFGGLLRDCTITGLAEIEMMTQSKIDENIRLLTEIFRNVKQHSQKGSLASLYLRVIIHPQILDDEMVEPKVSKSRKDIWATALRTFNTTMAALKCSEIPVDCHLNLFGGIQGCSLRYESFLSLSHTFCSSHVFSSLKKLTVSLSSSYTDIKPLRDGSNLEGESFEPPEPDNMPTPRLFHGILEMSEIMPQLETLDLHWYKLTMRVITQFEAHLNSNLSTFACLKELTLRNVRASEANLLQFVKTLHPTSLTLRDVELVSGTYASLFEYMTSSDNPITSYYLDDIYENNRKLVHFDIPGSPKFPYQYRPDLGPSTLIRDISHAKESIHYRLPSSRPLGSGAAYQWRRNKRRLYGPPGYHYDFIQLNRSCHEAELNSMQTTTFLREEL